MATAILVGIHKSGHDAPNLQVYVGGCLADYSSFGRRTPWLQQQHCQLHSLAAVVQVHI